MPARRTINPGDRFGKLTVVSRHGSARNGERLWKCSCDCGEASFVTTGNLPKMKSCGCWRRKQSTTHGMSMSAEYKIWDAMMQRCNNPKTHAYGDYGGRGILVCDRWKLFTGFFRDMGLRPTPAHTVERTDNSKGYSPDNCKWATRAEQGMNKRSNHLLTFENQTLPLTAWARRKGIRPQMVFYRIAHGWSVSDALTIPSQRTTKNASPI